MTNKASKSRDDGKTSVVFVMPHLHTGGAERLTIDQLTQMSTDDRLELTLILARRTGALMAEVPPSVRILDLGGVGHRSLLLGAWRLRAYLEEMRPTVVIAKLWFGIGLVFMARCWLPNWNGVTINVEDSLPVDYKKFVRLGGVKFRLLRRAHLTAEYVIAVSPEAARQVEAMGVPRHRVRVLLNGIDIDRVNALAVADPYPIVGAPYLVQVGSLKYRKGPDRSISLLTSLPRQLRLVFVGDGADRPELEELARTVGVANRVVFAGNHRNPYPLIAGAAALIQPSRCAESFGIVGAEALLLGVPIIRPTGQFQLTADALEMEFEFRTLDDASLLAATRAALARKPSPDERSVAREAITANHDIRRTTAELTSLILR